MIPGNLSAYLVSSLGASFGVRFTAELSQSRDRVFVRALGLERPHGFRLVVRPGLAMISATVEFDSMAVGLLNDFRDACNIPETVLKLSQLVNEYRNFDIKFNFDSAEDLSEKDPIESHLLFGSVATPEMYTLLVESLLSLIFVALDLDKDENSFSQMPEDFDEEGRLLWSMTRRYERSRHNRALALRIHGYKCNVCGFSFANTYGEIGRSFVEVHHLTPVSMMEAVRPVDPRTELIPLCSNCHRMAHRKWPPYAPEDLIEAIRLSNSVD